MTVEGNALTIGASTADAVVDCKAEFQSINISGIRQNDHAGFWLTNLSVTAAEVIWYRLDDTVATVAGNDCYPLRPGERVYVRKTDQIHYIAFSGTPQFCVAGDQSGIVYS